MHKALLLFCAVLLLGLCVPAWAEEKCGLEPPKEGEPGCGEAAPVEPAPEEPESKEGEPKADGALSCVSWRQTGNCNPYGEREASFDVGCGDLVNGGWSGYCECSGGVHLGHVNCQHEPFFCDAVCAKGVDRSEEEQKQRTIEFLNSENPYLVLQLTSKASPKEIRKAYKKLSMLYHPDLNVGDDTASDLFGKIVAAYEVLGNPDKRAAYDNLGAGKDGQQGYDTFWEYQQSGASADNDFFSGHSLITSITQKVWDHQISEGDHIWFVEFYAPWCSHCINSVPHWKELANQLEDNADFPFDVELGAINGAKERDLMKKFGIQAYPTLILFSLKMGMEVKYPRTGARTVEPMLEWLQKTLTEWTYLHNQANLVQLWTSIDDMPATREEGTEEAASEDKVDTQEHVLYADMLESEDFWVILFMGSVNCRTCVQSKVNAHRLSADVRGVARVAQFDCDANAANKVHCQKHGIKPGEFRGFARGTVKAQEAQGGEVLFDPEQHPAHLALELIATMVKLTLKSELIPGDALEPLKPDIDYEDAEEEEEEEKPEPPPPFEHYGYAGDDYNVKRLGRSRSGKAPAARIGN